MLYVLLTSNSGITYTSSLRHAATLGLALLNLCHASVQYIRIACESDRTPAAHTRSFGSGSHGTTVGFSLSYNHSYSLIMSLSGRRSMQWE